MPNRFPLIVDSPAQQIKELPANDNLDLTSCGIVGVSSVGIGTTNPTAPFQINSGTTAVIVDSTGDLGIGTLTAPTKLYVRGTAASNIVGLGSVTGSTTLDLSQGNNFTLSLSGNITLTDPSNATIGQSGIILIQQDGVGSRTVGFGSAWDFPSSTAPTLSTGANALDCLTYFVRTSNSIVTNSILNIGTL